MEHDLVLSYRNISIHHLDREELEYELGVRGLPFTETETRAALQRRLKEHMKKEKEGLRLDLDFNRLEKTVDAEIEQLDLRIKQVKEYLLNREKYDGTRESLKTKLIHYFGRTKLLEDCTENEQDLSDIDALRAVLFELYNANFSRYSPLNQIEIEHINESLSNLLEANANLSERQEKDSSLEELIAIHPISNGPRESSLDRRENVSVNREKRILHSTKRNQRQKAVPNSFPYVVSPFMYPYMLGYSHPQMSDKVLKNHPNKPSQKVGEFNRSSHREKEQTSCSYSGVDRRNINRGSDSEDSDKHSDRVESHGGNRFQRQSRSRPVADWNLKYDGNDNGQNLMRFLREAEFYAKAENITDEELFRSAIHLFRGPAKTWFMVGIENEDFSSWREMKDELKREFLSPDHDHQNEIRAIARKHGARERFQDYFRDMQQIFNSLTKSLTEKKKFELVFRNLRADYKGHVISSEIDNLADLKRFGKRLDATYWYKYQTTTSETNTRGRSTQVNEIYTGAKPKEFGDNREDRYKTPKSDSSRQFESTNPRNKRTRSIIPKPTSSEGGSQYLVDHYQPPPAGVCLNCRLDGHDDRNCHAPKHKYCNNCGFHDVDTEKCPFCIKNELKAVSEGRSANRQ